MKICLALMLTAALGLAGELRPQTGDWIRLEVAKTGLMRGKQHVFEFPAYLGNVDAAKPAFDLRLESGKILVLDDWVSAADKKKIHEFTLKDMLDAAKHPYVEYRTTSVTRNGNGGVAQGILRIRGIEKPAEVKIQEVGTGVYEGSSSVDMRLFGLKPPSAALGAIGTDPIMQLRFRLTVR
jgi:hypothetical protein